MQSITRLRKLRSTAILLVLLCLTVAVFSNIAGKQGVRATDIVTTEKMNAADIPSDINYIDDDKKLFVRYCDEAYSITIPSKIDSSTYVFYGVINGYRFYRMSVSSLPTENINHEDVVGSFPFESSRLFRPYAPGLYIIGNGKVYTLEEAYEQHIVDIRQVFQLYLEKS